MIPAQRDDLEAVAAAAATGDPIAQGAFVRATQAEVWRLAAALVDRDTADDLTQETFLRALKALPSFEGRAGVRTWLLSIARRTCADHLRATVRRRRLGDRLLSAPADPGPDDTGLVDALDLLHRLDPPRRAAFVLTQVTGLSYAEAAAVEGVPVGTIRSRVARARAELVDALGTSPLEPASRGTVRQPCENTQAGTDHEPAATKLS
ncbi:sigma-70 family RNA polymerase sigma factor [Virgisporangium ochraceum]|uniref:RNA polymerase sigma factor n=1 Tax=Virgisporangium ochraceum TaxID=65505 RepID=A0A8J4EES6_9ACTN|nr:sigma-70 family RNA polymerase sigma factor [Virgisporangium ochraceum]GIJ71938.1 RNA polymerase sigma factor [Virgisporangium ochraceum]